MYSKAMVADDITEGGAGREREKREREREQLEKTGQVLQHLVAQERKTLEMFCSPPPPLGESQCTPGH